ncbi:transglutaminase [Flavobacterium sp. xlx-214]|uniref:transglutaminase domain-containing protein n=1 Tax=unclassified Flavobacterium TaxID=196869 RepID=UPI0015EF785B|nr:MULTISPECIES: transglutaminase domain-containing protein [unclassified Flavobacterium]MBA5791389.1 transglutaminase [Flavobacterium sp. xlx-221]QMI83459.1 transglutaminase [Flavobacterium sp. xlx-214]
MDISKIQILRFLNKISIPKPWDIILILLLTILILVPVFIIMHQNLIDPEWPFHLDRILLFVAITAFVTYILLYIKRFLLFVIILYVLVLFFGTIFAGYGFKSVYEDYRSMIFAMSDNPNPQDIIVSKLLPFPNKSKIIKSIEFDNPKVRNFALSATTKHFRNIKGHKEYRQIIQCFAIFKEIQSKWNYVNDPKNREYIATASESLEHFSGDCDDHAILMAASIRAIGGTPRLIHTKEHIYPEMLIGTKADLENIIYLIKEVLFEKESKGKTIHYHIDERGQVWLNLDYTAKYPGGPFMSEEILGELTLN